MNRIAITIFGAIVFFVFSCSNAQDSRVSFDSTDRNPMTLLDDLGIDSKVARKPEYRFQMVCSVVENGKLNKTVSYNTDNYYYPASLVKIPAALVLLEELKAQNIPLDAIPVFDTVDACGSIRFVELSHRKSISFRQMLTELIVVSDNNFYNAIYHFVTPQGLNERLKELGFEDVHIYRSFTGCERIDHLKTYPSRVYDTSNKIIYQQDATILDSTVLTSSYKRTKDRMFGSKHENDEGKIVDGAFDLNHHIEIPLEALHEMMGRFLIPDAFDKKGWDIRTEDREFLRNLLGMYPSEIQSSYRSIDQLPDDIYKYIKVPKKKTVRTLGKLGLSYGFASEVAYFQIPGTTDALLISYSVYVNANDTVNDGEYEYESVARPFAESLIQDIITWQRNSN